MARAARRVEERPDAHAVARQHHLPPARVPDREGEVAVEPRDAIRPHLFVEADDDLGVGMRAEADALRDQLVAQLDVVEDLAVEGDPDASRSSFAIGCAPAARSMIESLVWAKPKPSPWLIALAVGPAVAKRREHPSEQRLRGKTRVGHTEIASNPAHFRRASASETKVRSSYIRAVTQPAKRLAKRWLAERLRFSRTCRRQGASSFRRQAP